MRAHSQTWQVRLRHSVLAKSRSLITSPRARIFRVFTQTRYQGPNWLGLHACVTGVHTVPYGVSRLNTHTRQPLRLVRARYQHAAALQRRRPARLRPTAPRRCGSCASALGRRRRSPARWSTHARAATACKWPRSWSVVRTPEPHSERAMGAALTRPTGIASALARVRACGV